MQRMLALATIATRRAVLHDFKLLSILLILFAVVVDVLTFATRQLYQSIL